METIIMSYEFADGYKIRDQRALHFLTFTVEGWIDIFSRQRYRDIVLTNLTFCRKNKGLFLGAYVIMTNHLHLIAKSETGDLSGWIRDFKSFTTKNIIASIQNENESRKEWLLYMFQFFANKTNRNEFYKLWTGNNHPEEINKETFLQTKLSYIHQNPVRAGWVCRETDYLYSSASNYANGKGLIEIDHLF